MSLMLIITACSSNTSDPQTSDTGAATNSSGNTARISAQLPPFEYGIAIVGEDASRTLTVRGFLEQTYLILPETDNWPMNLRTYDIDDALRFPEHVPLDTYVVFYGSVADRTFDRDESGERTEIVTIRVEQRDYITAIRPYSDIPEGGEVGQIGNGYFVGRMLGENLVIIDGSLELPLMELHYFMPMGHTELRGSLRPAIRNNQTGEIYIWAKNRTLLVANLDMSIRQKIDIDIHTTGYLISGVDDFFC